MFEEKFHLYQHHEYGISTMHSYADIGMLPETLTLHVIPASQKCLLTYQLLRNGVPHQFFPTTNKPDS